MLPERVRARARRWALLVGVGITMVISETAHAGALSVKVEERKHETVVIVSDASGAPLSPKIATSRRGLMLTFRNATVEPQRIAVDGPRLEVVRTAQYGNRAVVRLMQRPNLRGGIKAHTATRYRDGVVELTVARSAAASHATTESKKVTQLGEEASVAGLQTQLGASTVSGTATAIPPATAPPPATAGDDPVAPVAPVAASTAAGAEPGWPDVPSASSVAAPEEPSDERALWSMVFLAAGALGLVPLIVWMRHRRENHWGSAQKLEVLARTSLGPKQHVVCIRVEDRELLIGVTEHQVRLLADLSTPPPVAHSHSNSIADPLGLGATRPAPQAAAQTPPPKASSSERVEAFKTKLSSALVAQGEDQPTPASWSDKSSGVIELEQILARSQDSPPPLGDEPPWAKQRDAS